MRHLLFILLTLSFTIVGAQEIELAVGIDSLINVKCDRAHEGKYMEPLSLNGDTVHGKKRNLYYRIGNGEWAKLDRKSRKDLCGYLSRNPDTHSLYRSYGKQIKKSNRILIGTFVTTGIVYFAPGGRILAIASLSTGTAWSCKKRNKAQGELFSAVSLHNSLLKKRLNDKVPNKRPIVAHN